ncbi:hypothetical protein BDR07DRAFT_980242 [Suillus spraguei]|nr:hypothetical protein BDR07DRAFT_980242 [Suillus spraguei]
MVAEHGNIQNSPTGHVGTSLPVDNTWRIMADVFQEASILYLHTVLSNSNSGASKLIHHFTMLMTLLQEFPKS